MPPLTDLPGWSQHARLLTLSTPLGADKLLAETAIIDESLGPVSEHAGFRIHLTALSADAHIPLTSLLGQPVRLDLQTSHSRTDLRPFHGHITAFAKLGANGGFARYQLTIEPWLAFLGHNRDNYLFQDKSVIQIVDELFADWAGQGRLIPEWRWHLADSSIYPQRGMTVQYQESDLAFLKRLLTEEGLFCWFEHAKGDDSSLGKHTLVIADHNTAFADNAQSRVRYTQFGATLDEDSLDRWLGRRSLDTTESNTASWDYRSLSTRPQSAASIIDNGALIHTAAWHDPGQYSWQDSRQGERMLLNQREAIDARMKQYEGQGTVRTAAPGTMFYLADHPEHVFGTGEDDRFLITAVRHQARNNLEETLPGAEAALGPVSPHPHPGLPLEGEGDNILNPVPRNLYPESLPPENGPHPHPLPLPLKGRGGDFLLPLQGEGRDGDGFGFGGDSTLNPVPRTPYPEHYRNHLTAQRAAIPWRALIADEHGRYLHPKPTARGALTGIVVGDGGPTHVDRDDRIRVQFPWQRGSKGASRIPHPTNADNATGDARLGVWLRVVVPVAGGNWGAHFIPRPGQEVIVAFLNGNIDRPVVTGAAYNGRGNEDAPGNRVATDALNATGNAPPWFAGQQGEHAHGAALSGIKTQQLATSQEGSGGFNQLVFDDTPGEGRIELSTTQYQSGLQLGHLKQQTGNARQKDRGHGAELATQAALALRAGAGLLISADARPNASSAHLDSAEAIARTQTAQQLTETLATLAQKQNAALKDDPEAKELPANQSLLNASEVLSAVTTSSPQSGEADTSPPLQGEGPGVGMGFGSGSNAGPGMGFGSAQGSSTRMFSVKATLGGTGAVPAWSQPRIQLSAPGGIAQVTPKNHFLVSGANTVLTSDHDIQFSCQGSTAFAIHHGLAIFAHGKSKKAGKPNQETGIHYHAASGKVSLQAQSGKITAAAEKKVTLASTEASLKASAPKSLLATAQGAYLKIEGGDIQLHAPGKVVFKASQKNWLGPKSSSGGGSLPKGELKGCDMKDNETSQDAVTEF